MSDLQGRGLVANTFANLCVGGAALGYAVIVPGVVVRRFGAESYGSWYLAFQVAAYVVLLDLGSQLLVTNAAATPSTGPEPARLTTAAMIAQSALAAVVVTIATAWAALAGDVRLAQLMVILGMAATASLLASTVRAWFGGLRRAHVPAVWLVCARIGSLAGLGVAVAAHASLIPLTLAVALPQLCVHAALLAWAHRPPSPWARPDRPAFAQLFRATGPLALWTVCGILIGGVDIFIVRAVDPSEVARYAVALPLLAIPTGVVTAAVTAWMPRITQAESARSQGGREPTLIGTTLLVAGLSIGALAFIGGADGLVRLLAGSGQWRAAVGYLQLLYLATALRFAMLPYVVLIVVRGEQGKLMLSPVAEAATNVVASVVLGLAFGAVGVALGTLGGAVVGVAAHLVRSVRRTAATGLTSSDLLHAAARAWPTVAAATVLGVLAVGHASGPWRGVAAVVAVAVDAWWLLDHARSMRAPFAPLEVVPER